MKCDCPHCGQDLRLPAATKNLFFHLQEILDDFIRVSKGKKAAWSSAQLIAFKKLLSRGSR